MQEPVDPELFNLYYNLGPRSNDMFPNASYMRSLHFSIDSNLSFGSLPAESGFAGLAKKSLQGHTTDNLVGLSLSSR